jgi:hypothetical protein
MSISFAQLIEMIQDPAVTIDRLRYCNLTSDIVHVVTYYPYPEVFGESFLTQGQLEQLQRRFPQLNIVQTGTFPIPTRNK